jgi:ketosteroid isomerase-like protein
MRDLMPSLAAETEILRNAYAALNRNDVPAAIEAFDPEFEWIEPDDYPSGGTHHGHANVQAHLLAARATWDEGSCEPERFIAAGDKVIVFLRVHVRLNDRTEWINGEIADVYTFRNGKAVQMRHFPDREQALKWVAVEASDQG